MTNHTLTLELSDAAYAAIRRQAETTGTSPARLAEISLERQFGTSSGLRDGGSRTTEVEEQAARERFERHFGAVDLDDATGADNEGIDADLAREYADDHDGD